MDKQHHSQPANDAIDEMASFIREIPKAELHIHLEGSIEPELMFRLAERNKIKLRWSSLAKVKESYRFADLQSFLNLYYEGCNVLAQEEDFYDMTLSYLRRASEDGVVWAELSLGMQNHTDHGLSVDTVLGGVCKAIDFAAENHGIDSTLVIIAQRHRDEAEAFELLERIMPWSGRIAAIGMGGAEVGNPPGKFARFFRHCRDQGFGITIHAGEEGPADYVREAVEMLDADRIDHGVASIDDPALVTDLARRKIPLTVCPISNIRLNNIASLDRHPVKKLMDAGVAVTINSDDPSYFDAYVAENLIQCQRCFNLSKDDIAGLARNGFVGSFMTGEEKKMAIRKLDAFLRGEN
ncbi:MAG: adenosine deaminase [Planctomycetes bacterium]|nr:adenosine deaminase [Planctomycetota bacterium]